MQFNCLNVFPDIQQSARAAAAAYTVPDSEFMDCGNRMTLACHCCIISFRWRRRVSYMMHISLLPISGNLFWGVNMLKKL